MKKVRTSKARKERRKCGPAPEKALKRVDLDVVREQITNLVGNRAVEMVETTMDEVEKGHYLAMKYLFEMVGLCPAATSEEATAGRFVGENSAATVEASRRDESRY